MLKPNGVLALNVWDSLAKNRAVQIADEVIKGFFEDDPPRFLEIPFGFHDIDAGRKLFEGAGLLDPDVAYVRETVTASDYSTAARGFVTGNPTIIEIEQRATVGVDDILDAAAAALENEFGPTPAELEFQEIVYLARKTGS